MILLHVTGVVDKDLTAQLIEAVKQSSECDDKRVCLVINSDGGDADTAIACARIMQAVNAGNRVQVWTLIAGSASSAAAILATSGKRGHRYALQGTGLMIHEVQAELGGSAGQIRNTIREIDRTSEELWTILRECTGKRGKCKVRELFEAHKHDLYLRAEEAIALGLLDKIGTPKGLLEVTG